MATDLERSARRAPASGCFGEHCDDEHPRAKRSAAEIFAEWERIAPRFALLGYRDDKRER